MNKVRAAVAVGALALAVYFIPSPEGVTVIQKQEGRVLVAYLDAVGIPTICDGSTRDVRLGQVATNNECDELLKRDLEVAVQAVQALVVVPITQGQFDALVSFTYNVGGTALRKSTLLKYINTGECTLAGQEFNRWVYAKGVRLNGLRKRRAIERKFWDSGCTAWESPEVLPETHTVPSGQPNAVQLRG